MLKTPKILKIMNGSNLLVNINCAINNLLLDWEIKVLNVIIYTKNDRYSNNRDKSLFLNSFSLIIFMKNHVRKNLH